MGNYWTTIQSLNLADMIAYWRLNEASGTAVYDSSAHARGGVSTDVTWGTDGIDGFTVGSFNGTSSTVDVYTASFVSAFNGSAGTIFLWAKVSSAAIWADGTAHLLCRFIVDASNQVRIEKGTTNNLLNFIYVAGGTTKTISQNTAANAEWFCMALTWDRAAGASGELKAYYNGTQVGGALDTFGDWVGTLNVAGCEVGGNGTPSYWSGLIGHVALWDVALSGANITTLSTWTPIPVWTTPITDRALADITARNSKAFLNIADWARIYNNTVSNLELVQALIDPSAAITTLTPPAITDFPTAALINSLVGNIDGLRESASLPAATGIVELKHDYIGGTGATSPNYIAVNNWENDLLIIREKLPLAADYKVFCGVATTGQARLWQAQFRG